jgi:hypothetical protein
MLIDLIQTACLIRGRKVPLYALDRTLGKNLPIKIPSLKIPSRTGKENVKAQGIGNPTQGVTILLKTQDGSIRMKYRIDGKDPVGRSVVTHDCQIGRRGWSVKCLNPDRYRIDGKYLVGRYVVTHDHQIGRRRWSVKCLNPDRY